MPLNFLKDPVRSQLIENEYEKSLERAFDEVALAVLHTPREKRSVERRGRTRPILEPTEWGQQQLQGTRFGRFAQACQKGSGFVRARRGGFDAFLPREADGVYAAGARKSRWCQRDMGILKGDHGWIGEAAKFKTQKGSSCGAPMQDHYSYESSKEVTDMEFPPGKRVFPRCH